VLVAIVVGLGAWWLLPVVVACIMMLIFGVAVAEPLSASTATAAAGAPAQTGLRNLPNRFWFYAAAVFLYGILETLNGNWVRLYLSVERGVSAQGASGTGPLRDSIGLSFSTIFSAGSIVALPLIVVTWFVIRRPLAA
jgi:hypothetical protein